ncbi:hypothetical protein MNBD_GAMMA09-2957 [hydrothermal vent metagenome]|uniref:Uncharacterized protein n=1 Tax=hydrothermal vent metagenome TaxID=652676 RepID=A0A3B0XC98_9ZZZZ
MHLKTSNTRDLIEIGKLLLPDANENDFNFDCENIYEWIYINVPEYNFVLNISREHGMARLANEVLDKCKSDEELEKMLTPGPVYIFCIDEASAEYADMIPDSLISYISQRLNSAITVFPGRLNVVAG